MKGFKEIQESFGCETTSEETYGPDVRLMLNGDVHCEDVNLMELADDRI
jgi:hypothetical protein